MKVAHSKAARELGSGKTKVISVYPGQFLEYLFGAGVSLFLSSLVCVRLTHPRPLKGHGWTRYP